MDAASQPIKDVVKQTELAEQAVQQREGPEKDALCSLLELQKTRNSVRLRYLAEWQALLAKYSEIYTPMYQERASLVAQVPGFWLRVLKNHSLTKLFIEERDEPLLMCLEVITVEREADSDNFSLVFRFSENDYMTNCVLSKRYVMSLSLIHI